MPRLDRAAAAFAAACILGLIATPVQAQNTAVTINIDTTRNRHPINPNIYGVSYGTPAQLSDLNAPMTRYGGNNASRYNWNLNADNRGSDWYFESIGDSSATPGERGDTFIANAKSVGAQALLTVPMIGWVAKLGINRSKLDSFSQAKYGPQTGNDWQWYPDAGNGVLKSTGKNVSGNDPNDADVPADSVFQAAWAQHLVSRWGNAASGGLKYYILDNEPSLWEATHRDVHPVGAKMDEVRDKIIDYAAKIKAIDPGAQIVAPEEWGWSGYFYSGYDLQYGGTYGWSYLPDRSAHNGWDYVPYLLDQLRENDQAKGSRSIDVFSLHYYPQGGEFSSDTSTSTQLLRNQSTRSLWDPNYVDKSWIGSVVQLIPRMKSWVGTYYPGLQTAITEYNWGAEGHINGATTQADIYGIFGREGLDISTRWTTPNASTPTYKAMKMYRNVDGRNVGFGDTSVLCAAPNPDNLSAFAATRSADGMLTIMIISKVLSGSTPVTLNLAGFSGNGIAHAWQLTAANAIAPLSDVTWTGTTLTTTVPAQSITLFELPPAGTPIAIPRAPTNLTAGAGDSRIALQWNVSANAVSYNLYLGTSPGGESITPFKTGLTSTSLIDTSVTNGTAYYYKVTAVNPAGESARSNEASGTPSVAAGASAVFIKTDSTTEGTWKTVYGQDGYDIAQLSAALPSYATISFSGQSNYTWTASTADVRAVQKPNATDRIAACWYAASDFTVDLNLTDGQVHTVAWYLLDWDTSARSTRVDVQEASTGLLLDTQSVSAYNLG